MKKFAITAAILSSLILAYGCKTSEYRNDKCVQSTTVGASFNDSHYVWEGFIFSTNRVNNIK